MFIKDIRNPYDDDGVTTVRLDTAVGTAEGLMRASTSSEIFTWRKVCKNLNLPSPLVELTSKPSGKLVQDLLEKGIIVKYYPDVFFPYYVDFVKATMNFQLDKAYPIISLPDFKESTTQFRDKLDVARKIKSEHPNKEKCELMPYIRTDYNKKHFEKRLAAILNRPFKMIGIDIHGYNTENLAYLKEVLSRWETDLWVHASNLPKKVDKFTKASFPHILTYYHIHSYALRKGRYYSTENAEDVEQFDSIQLGIIPWKDLPFTFGVNCRCPFHNHGEYFTDDINEMVNHAKIHDMVDGQDELQRATISIKEENFERYIRSKKCATAALFS
jgi:hypothetical protein